MVTKKKEEIWKESSLEYYHTHAVRTISRLNMRSLVDYLVNYNMHGNLCTGGI